MAESIYQQLVNATTELLGPASGRFIDRQIENHLKIQPHELRPKDIVVLAEWIRLSMGLLTDDAKTLSSYSSVLDRLSRGRWR